MTVALCFPDLYEIGMSNNAMRILYSGLNALEGVRCERVFAPARDFEALLRDTGTPLYTLESGIPLRDVDILAFTVGYELAATSILTVLDLGGIPLDATLRKQGDPVVIAGGPAVTNPHPLSRFLDAVWIGEAEAGFFSLAGELAGIRPGPPGRDAILSRLRSERAFWMRGKKAVRAVDSDFSEREYDPSFPWPSIKPVQDHGTVEIMRGCPNGCRFCHAGYYYRPQRIRSAERIFREVESLVMGSGYREITLASLSSGDYPQIVDLVRELNRRWGPRRVSFQLPSLKVESFTLPVIEELAHTRKSGLTFAVETPEEAWQRAINKSVTLDKILEILREAGNQGYRLAKFYFMIGLPVSGEAGESETESMIAFLREILSGCKFQLNVNIGTFIPKPHTPFQWCPQIDEEEANARIRAIRDAFRSERRIKISYHTPFVSKLEGILSRGDERVGDLVLEAWRGGARLDAWEDLLNKEAWRLALSSVPDAPLLEALGGRPLNASLPWDDVSIKVGKQFLLREWERSIEAVRTSACMDNCTNPCGSCGSEGLSVENNAYSITAGLEGTGPSRAEKATEIPARIAASYRLVARYIKTGASAFLPHHSVIDLLYRAFQLSRLPVAFSQGFNPLPRLEIEEPIPLGMPSQEDYFSVLLVESVEPAQVSSDFNRYLPPDLRVDMAALYKIREGTRNRSLSSLYWGSDYYIESSGSEFLSRLSSNLLDPRLEGSQASEIEGNPSGILLRLHAGGKREIGFASIFERSFGEPFSLSKITVTRVRQWADIGNGPVAYFEALDCLYETPE